MMRYAKLTSVFWPIGHQPGTKVPPPQPTEMSTQFPWPFGELHAP